MPHCQNLGRNVLVTYIRNPTILKTFYYVFLFTFRKQVESDSM